jgi:hypothetical protein
VAESLHALQVVVVVHLRAILEVVRVRQAVREVASVLGERHHVVAVAHIELLLRELLLGLGKEFWVHLQVVLVVTHSEGPSEFNLRTL